MRTWGVLFLCDDSCTWIIEFNLGIVRNKNCIPLFFSFIFFVFICLLCFVCFILFIF